MAKLAWKFVTNSSWWMQFIRSKKCKDGFNSYIWTKIKPYVLRHRRESFWVFGKGNVTLGHFNEWFNHPIPKNLLNYSLKDIQNDDSSRQKVLEYFPGLSSVLDNLEMSDDEDQLIWTPCRAGEFSTKKFYDLTRNNGMKDPFFAILWQRWLPTKISIFLWRVLHYSLSTDDRVQSLGINIASKCWCCSAPNVETMNHCLFEGSVARELWGEFSCLFGKGIPTSLDNFLSEWLLPLRKRDFETSMVFAAGSIILWMLWKYRNKSRMEGQYISCRHGVVKWVAHIAQLTPPPTFQSLLVSNIIRTFQINVASSGSLSGVTAVWKPHCWGITLNCNIMMKHSRLFYGFLYRNRMGELILAGCFEVRNNCLLTGINKCLLLWPQASLKCIQSSHSDMELLAKHQPPWEVLRQWRKLKERFYAIKMQAIPPNENNSANVLAYLGREVIFQKMTDLPPAPMLAFRTDRRRFYKSHRIEARGVFNPG